MSRDLFELEPAPAGKEGEPAPVVLRLHVQPGAGRSAVAGRRGDALHVRVAPPPADGRANAAVVELVAELVDVPLSQVELVGGERSRSKRVRVLGVAPEAIERLLDEALDRAAAAPGRGGRRGR